MKYYQPVARYFASSIGKILHVSPPDRKCCALRLAYIFLTLALTASLHASEKDETESSRIVAAPDAVPDIRQDESKLKFRKRDFVIVPIPMSNPTLDTGLVLGGAYFHPQSEQEKARQPASVTGAAGLYTSNKSKAFALGHQSYMAANTWRVGGVLGYADLSLKLPKLAVGDEETDFNWLIAGEFIAARVSRKIFGQWYLGVQGRYIAFDQSFETATMSDNFDVTAATKSVGLGIVATFDKRDKPLNSFSGSIFEFKVLVNDTALGGDANYTNSGISYRSYHSIGASTVLAWELEGCKQSEGAPLWDSCRLGLRGFSATEYMGKSSASAQVELRQRFNKKWGAVAFLGGGSYNGSFSDLRENDLIHSYGLGLRFMLLESQRVNLRVDYARSNGSDAIYLSVGEAF
jgi:hypothetical protein